MPVLYNLPSAHQSWQGMQGLPKQAHAIPSMRQQRNGHPGTTSVASCDYPGATGPGVGLRRLPEVFNNISKKWRPPREREEKFDLKTTKDYYRDFPAMIRASFPLYIKNAGKQEPLGQLELREKDAGPQTGQRRMPGLVDPEGRNRPRMPWMQDRQEDLLKEKQDQPQTMS